MAKEIYFGDANNKARTIVGGYIGIDGVARKILNVYVGDVNGIARLCWEAVKPFKVIYNANGGAFSNGSTTNIVEYKRDRGEVTKTSKTSNVSNDGLTADVTNGYGNNQSITDVITIPGAKQLEVTITYQTESTSYDWVCIYEKGVTPSSSNYSSSLSGKLGGTTKTTKTYTVPGDTAQFYFKSDGSSCKFYGYYATVVGVGNTNVAISGEELIPSHSLKYMKVDGWYTNPECTEGNEFDIAMADSDIEVYAKWVDVSEAFAVYSDTDNSLRFYRDVVPNVDATEYNGLNKTAVYTGVENTSTTGAPPWSTYKPNITKVVFEGKISPSSTLSWFSSCNNLISIEKINNLDTSKVTNMNFMFDGCKNLTTLELPESFNTSSVTNMYRMFYNCNALTSLTLPETFDTSNVTNMGSMFHGCNALTTLTLPEAFNTSNVTTMGRMFDSCNALTSLTLPESFNTSKVTDMSIMFNGCKLLTSLTLPESFNTSKVTNMGTMFQSCNALTSLTLPEAFDTSSVTDMGSMFNGCSNLTTLILPETFNTSNVTDMGSIFRGCKVLTTLTLPEAFDTSSVTDMSNMFGQCNALTTLELPETFNTSNVTDMSNMFSGCKVLTTLTLPETFNTSSVTNMSNMFGQCNALTTLELPETFDTSNVTNMSNMFSQCKALTTLELSETFDTSNVTNMSNMFYYCTSLTTLTLPETFDTSNVTNTYMMFNGCNALTSLTLPESFNTSKVTNMDYMFNGCSKLQEIALPSVFKWIGTNGYLPIPNSYYISGANGKWYSESSTAYTPSELATAFNADPVGMAGTYYAVKPN